MKIAHEFISSAAVSLLFFVNPAASDSIKVTGTITSTTNASLLDAFSIGEKYQFQFEWTGPTQATSPGNFLKSGSSLVFQSAQYGISASFVDYYLRLDTNVPFARVNISSRWFPGNQNYSTPLEYSSTVAGRFPYYVGLEMTDPTGSAFTSLQLTTPLFAIQDFSQREFEIAFASQISSSSADGVVRIFGTVDDISLVAQVPEIPSQVLLLSGLIATAALRRILQRHNCTASDA